MAEEARGEQVVGLVELPAVEAPCICWTWALAVSRAVIGVISSWLVSRIMAGGANL
jgi:hypothetical protein